MTQTFYTEQHEWIRFDDSSALAGITDYAQEQLGDIVYVELPQVGQTIEKGKEAAVIESVKAASEVYMPVTGKITAVNDELNHNPALVNQDAEGKAWFFRFVPDSLEERKSLMDQNAYQNLIKEED